MVSRRFVEAQIVVASHNDGKVTEINNLLAPFSVQVISAKSLGLPEPVEDGTTFIENAEIKARAAANVSRLPALADDSGLVVPAIGGQPGIYSARWAGQNKNFNLAMKRVWKEIGDNDPTAKFICALSLCWPNDNPNLVHIESFEGVVHGKVIWPPLGENGFGYDPIFVPQGFNRTFGQLTPSKKHKISHRAIAFKMLVASCFRH